MPNVTCCVTNDMLIVSRVSLELRAISEDGFAKSVGGSLEFQ